MVAWEAEGDSRGLERMTAAFWDDGTAWLEEQLGEKESSWVWDRRRLPKAGTRASPCRPR